MAKKPKIEKQLRFRDSETDPRTEKATEHESEVRVNKSVVFAGTPELSPFERVKIGTGQLFLAANAIPVKNRLN